MKDIRKCIKCNIEKPLSQFFKHQHGDGFSKNCIMCTESHDSNDGIWDWDRIYKFFESKKDSWNKRLWNMLVPIIDHKDDIEQETLIRLWKSMDNIKDDNNPSGYIFITYKNLIYNRLHKIERHTPLSRYLTSDYNEAEWLENNSPTEIIEDELEMDIIKNKLSDVEYKWLIEYFERKNVEGNKFSKRESSKCNRLKKKVLSKNDEEILYFLTEIHTNEIIGPFKSMSDIAKFTGKKRQTIDRIIKNEKGTVTNKDKSKKFKIFKKIRSF